MNILNTIYLGNTLQNWLIALCILAAVFTVLKIIQQVVISRLSKLAAATDNQIDDLLVSMIKQTKWIVLLIASAYIASYAITLKPSLAAILHKAVVLILIFQAGLWAGAAISFWLEQAAAKRKEEDAASAPTIGLLGFVARLIVWVIVLLLMLDNLGVNITGLVAGLGIGGVAVALAVQNILGDLLASLSIVLDKPFIIGDFIVVDSLAGTVEHIGLKTTRIRSLNGGQLIFANNDLLKSRIRNYKRMEERRAVFSFGVVYDTPPEKLMLIKSIIRDIIEREPNARFDRAHFKDYGDSSLNFEVVYFVTKPDMILYMDIQEKINLDLLRRFQKEGIAFAYPTRTVLLQNSGKNSAFPA
jgi:small-conductance mechanosensitive channel